MNSEMVIVITVFVLAMFLGTWGASLVVRALASRASRIAMRLARRIPKSLNTAPPTLSPLQFWFGMIAGPIVSVLGVALVTLVLGPISREAEIKMEASAIPAVMLAMLSMGMLMVGMRWDPANGRRRCPRCWYDFHGFADDAPCPECGGVAATARALLRTRRNRALVRLAPLVLLLAWGGYVAPSLERSGWPGMIPTWVLIAGFERFPDSALFSSTAATDGTLSGRVWNGSLTPGERQWLTNRSLRLLNTSKEPRTLALAATFLNCTPYRGRDGGSVTAEARDEANANLLEAMFRVAGDSTQVMYVRGMASQSSMSNGPRTRAMVAQHVGEILPAYTNAVAARDRTIWASLIARLAPATPEVVGA